MSGCRIYVHDLERGVKVVKDKVYNLIFAHVGTPKVLIYE